MSGRVAHQMALDPQQQAHVLAAKLRALCKSGLGLDIDEARGVVDGAVGYSASASTVAYLSHESSDRCLGRAMAVGIDKQASTVHVICSDASGVVARRAAEFDLDLRVWAVNETALTEAHPLAHANAVAPDDETLGFAAEIAAAGADPVVEHGVLKGEVRGLEVLRVEHHDGELELRIGVGDFDRDAFGLLHGNQPSIESVRDVVATVASHRRPGATFHPLNRTAPEAWLRSRLMDDPGRIGFESLVGAEPPVERISIKDAAPAVAIGTRDGTESVVVISSGIDLDLVPYAADARLRLDASVNLVVVVPERDAHRVTREMVSHLRLPAELVIVENDWRLWP